jgi:hypothetical protein
MTVLNKLGQQVEVQVTVQPRQPESEATAHT